MKFQHSYASNAALFSIKALFTKLITFFISTTRDIYTKLLKFSESPVKIKARSLWTFLVTLLTSAVTSNSRYCIKRRMCNNFKTTNAMALTETILEGTFNSCTKFIKKKNIEIPCAVFKDHSAVGYF